MSAPIWVSVKLNAHSTVQDKLNLFTNITSKKEDKKLSQEGQLGKKNTPKIKINFGWIKSSNKNSLRSATDIELRWEKEKREFLTMKINRKKWSYKISALVGYFIPVGNILFPEWFLTYRCLHTHIYLFFIWQHSIGQTLWRELLYFSRLLRKKELCVAPPSSPLSSAVSRAQVSAAARVYTPSQAGKGG